MHLIHSNYVENCKLKTKNTLFQDNFLKFDELIKDLNHIINLLTKSLKTAKDNKLNKE